MIGWVGKSSNIISSSSSLNTFINLILSYSSYFIFYISYFVFLFSYFFFLISYFIFHISYFIFRISYFIFLFHVSYFIFLFHVSYFYIFQKLWMKILWIDMNVQKMFANLMIRYAISREEKTFLKCFFLRIYKKTIDSKSKKWEKRKVTSAGGV